MIDAELPAIRQVLTHATNQKRTAPKDVAEYWNNVASVASKALNEKVGETDRDNARRQIPENVRLLKGYLARRNAAAAPSGAQT